MYKNVLRDMGYVLMKNFNVWNKNKKTHEGPPWVKIIFVFLIQFLKTEKIVTQLFIQKPFCVFGIRDHAFLSLLRSFA